MCAAHANLSTSWYACNLRQGSRFSARVNRLDTITALFSNKLHRPSKDCGYTLMCSSPLEAEDSWEVLLNALLCCWYSFRQFSTAYVGNSYSEVTGLKLKLTGMPDQKKTEKVSGNRNKYP